MADLTLVRGAFTPGDFVVVVGPGPIGLLTAMVARASGARDVVILGTPGDEDLRMKKARELGFTKLVNVSSYSLAIVMAYTKR